MGWLKTFKRHPLSRLAEAIVLAAHQCTQSAMKDLKFASDNKKNEVWFQILCEFL